MAASMFCNKTHGLINGVDAADDGTHLGTPGVTLDAQHIVQITENVLLDTTDVRTIVQHCADQLVARSWRVLGGGRPQDHQCKCEPQHVDDCLINGTLSAVWAQFYTEDNGGHGINCVLIIN